MKKRETRNFFLFFSPWAIGFLLLTLIPMAMSLYYSFTDWDVFSKAKFVGLDNYIEMFNNDLFWKSVKVTLFYSAWVVPLDIVLGFLLAVMLNFEGKLVGLFRTLYYLPAALSTIVVSLVWRWLYDSEYGAINSILSIFGIEGIHWLSDPNWALPALIIMNIWAMGGGIIMYLAGLQAVPVAQYEAARLDGAGWWSRLWHITIPSMSPILLFMGITTLLGALQTFTQTYIITSGGPNNATLFYVYQMYQEGIVFKNMGYACAMAWVFFIFVVILCFILLKIINKKVYYESDEGGAIA